MGFGDWLASGLGHRLNVGNPFGQSRLDEIARQCRDLSGHVIVCGHGDLGRALVAILQWQGIPTLALEADHNRGGEHVLVGDFCRPGVISAAGLDRARAVALTFADLAKAVKIEKRIHAIRPDVPILAYGGDRKSEARLRRSNVTVFPGDLELSLAFGRQLMAMLGESPTALDENLQALRADNYRQLRILRTGPERERQ